ncbi:MAG: ABC transporter ATP-binding protein [Deltaproteobacteria bacterium]|nr:ABC transporter ATP-binding protein [Deltaproteobacteria bacterium]MBW2179737.1 ABC transporter ATP-binding protein [Deltaproteobacteria bacterium]MBW2364578.1 ABC transporter ATP-binding protein [Deltaproteobacteria bacterium]
MTKHLIRVKDVVKNFDGLNALRSVSMDIEAGKIEAIIGPNGAGKTTFFNIICGLETADSGSIYFNDVDISKTSSDKIANLGISRTFQTSQFFEHLNVIENIMVGRYLKTSVSFFLAGLWLPKIYREEHRNMVKAFEKLEFLELYDKADRKLSQITFQERKLIEIGRCLAMEPKLLLLDEPFGGLNITEIKFLAEKLIQLKQQGMTILIIDHHFGTISNIADEIVVLNHGEIIAKGKAEKIRTNEAVIDAYLPS